MGAVRTLTATYVGTQSQIALRLVKACCVPVFNQPGYVQIFSCAVIRAAEAVLNQALLQLVPVHPDVKRDKTNLVLRQALHLTSLGTA